MVTECGGLGKGKRVSSRSIGMAFLSFRVSFLLLLKAMGTRVLLAPEEEVGGRPHGEDEVGV